MNAPAQPGISLILDALRKTNSDSKLVNIFNLDPFEQTQQVKTVWEGGRRQGMQDKKGLETEQW